MKGIALLLILTLTAGCATMTGIVTGAVTGPVSCLPKIAKEVSEEYLPWWERAIGVAIGLLSPVLGMIVGAINGFEIDRDAILYDAEPRPHQIKTFFDPCG